MDENITACYGVLEVTPSATAEEIKAAYLDLVKVWHPDRYTGESERLRRKAEEKLKAINLAYERIRTGAVVFRGAARGESRPAAEASPELAPASFGSAWGFVGPKGRLVIPPRFEDARPFSEGLALVRENGRCGFIDSSGDYAIYPEFAEAHSFREEMAAVSLSVRWGYIDRANRFVVHPLYDHADDFSEGLAAVCWRGRWGYIDREGRFAIRPAYDGARAFRDGRAEVLFGQRWGSVRADGQVFFEHQSGEIPASA